MALIKCIECGRTISDKAEYCIYCGCPISEMINCQPDVTYEIETELLYEDEGNKTKDTCGLIECPVCHMKQKSNRVECYSCGTKFDHNNIEYCENEEEKIDFAMHKF